MSRICPQCGNLNDDGIKFCTSCGKLLETAPLGYGSPVLQTTAPVAGDGAQRRLTGILAGAVIVIILVIAIVWSGIHPGVRGFFPPPVPAAITQTAATPGVTSFIRIETPTTGPAAAITENLSATTSIPEPSLASPAPTKPVTCSSDLHSCGAICADFMTDANNCGACGVSCSFPQECQQGTCRTRCEFGEISCFDGCHNLSYDALNCGACGNSCPVGLECNASVCTPPPKTAIPTYAG